jgi:hypothetical protein
VVAEGVGEERAGDAEQFGDEGTAEGVVRLRAGAADGDEVAPAQGGELLGHDGLPEGEVVLELADGPLAAGELLEDPDAGRVGEGAEELALQEGQVG